MERCVALFLGGFALLDLAGSWIHPDYDGNLLWIDLRRVPAPAGRILLAAAAILLLWFAVAPRPANIRRIATVGVTGLLVLAALANVATFYVLPSRARFHDASPLPLSLPIALLLVVVLIPLLLNATLRPRSIWALAATLPVLGSSFPLAQMVFFGTTDDRRPAEAAVVFGARAYANGKASRALADRVRTGCALYHEGLAPVLILSGGPGDGDVHETEVMRTMAIALGVPTKAIIIDAEGVNTKATIVNTTRLLEERGWRRILAVSHGYHLPRIKMTYGRAGRRVFTVPVKETQRIAKMPFMMAREVAAFWLYWLRDAFGFS